ncbi:hypothetical protein MNBD_DELTA01-1227 [hydrothermal vent metagenome]|uniref:Glycosyltransferase RgtA/B/C/D-like domain-containing protein n=1 Tax=hydrothermal vent metagenome TaxID=652676 RepID=A0A3B0QYF3_9ZZZZ
MSTLELTALIGIVLGGLCLLVFSMAHAGLVSPFYMAAAVALALLCFFIIIRRFLRLRSCGDLPVDLPPDEGGLSPLEWVLLVVSALFVLFILPFDLAPPIARDELIQHLTIPALYLRSGGAVEIPFMGHSYVPMNLNMLYLAGLSFGSEALPRLIHHGFGLLTAIGIYSYLRYRTTRVYCLLAALLFITTPVVMNLSTTAYVDLGAAFFATMALLALLRWRHSGSRWFYYSAILLGLALGTKYNMIVAFALLVPMAVFISLKRGSTQPGAVKAGFVYAAIAVVVFSPWLVRNLIWTGSPLYPLIGAFIGGSGTGVHTGGAVSPIEKRYLLYGESLLGILMVPLRIFWEGVDGSIRKFDGVLNPLLLLFIVFTFMRRLGRGNRYIWYLLIYSLLFFAMTFFTTDLVIRYILPVLPPLVIISVAGIRASVERGGASRYIALGGLLLYFVFSLFYLNGLHARYAPVRYLAGSQSRAEYLLQKLPDYETTAYANANIAKDSKVLFLFTGERTYYWEREYFYGGRLGKNLLAQVKRVGSAEELLADMRGQGFTHLFVMDRIFDRFAFDNFTASEQDLLRGFFGKNVRRLHSANGFSLYRLGASQEAR